jgi:hypothetical protein
MASDVAAGFSLLMAVKALIAIDPPLPFLHRFAIRIQICGAFFG